MPFDADGPSDEGIVSLFREWIAAQTAAEALGARVAADDTPEKVAFDTACDRIAELVGAIADIPSGGRVGLAIKAFLRHHWEHPSDCGSNPATLGEFAGDDPYDELQLSIIEDAVRFVPELAPLAAAAIGPAESEAA